MSKSQVLAEPVLVGREKELEELHAFLKSAVEGKGKTVFVSGEAGSGKTRLAREFLKAAVRKGVAVMAGWCLSDAQVPYFPLIEAFNSYFASSSETQLVDSLSEPGKPFGPSEPFQMITQERGISAWLTGATPTLKPGGTGFISPQVWKDQLFAGVAKMIHAVAAQTPVVLFIEDVHWADSASLGLLHYVSRAINMSERVLVLATFRIEELTSDAEGRPHPLVETLRFMRREELFDEIKLSNLDRENISKMAESMIGGSLQPKLSEKLAAESRGNPLFVVESLRMLNERKSLVQENKQWGLAVDELGIPSKIKDIILRRLSRLKYAQRRVLDAASVIGEEFNVELLSTVLGQDSLDVLETLSLIAQSTSIVLDAGDYYRFDHARPREVLYEELSTSLKKGYHNRIAEKLESIKSGALPLSDIAYHYAQAGNSAKAVKFALAAGRDELEKWSNAQAIKHFQYALQNISDGSDGAELKRAAKEGLGDAYAANSMYAEAIKTFDELAASTTGLVRLCALRKASDAAFHRGDKPDLLIEYAKKAEELAVYDRLEMARIINNRGRAGGWAGRGDTRSDLADYDVALGVFEEENSLPDVAEALWRSGIASSVIEDLKKKGLGELLRSVAIFRELGDVRKEAEVTLYLGCGFRVNGLYSEARREFVKVPTVGQKLGVFFELSSASIFLSELDEREGKLANALSLSLKALEYCRKTDAVALVPSYATLARLYSKLGDLENAEECFETIAKQPPEIVLQGQEFITRSKAVFLAAQGLGDEANQIFENLIEFLRSMGFTAAMAIEIYENYAWALEKQGRLEKARVQQEKAQKMLKQVDVMFERAEVQLSVMAPRKVQVGEEFEMRLDLVNVSRNTGVLAKIEDSVPPEFKVVDLPSFCSLQGSSIAMKEKSVGPFQVETIKLKLKATEVGSYALNPEVFYLDDLGNAKTLKTNPITITAQLAKPTYEVLPGRIATGTAELDRLLLGGIPEGYAVALVSPSFEERQKLIRNYVEAGAKNDQVSFFLTVDSASAEALAEKYPSSFVAFVCNPRADLMKDFFNVFKLKGVESLTEIDISLERAFRRVNSSQTGMRRACVEIVSDVLLQHHAVTTRKWLSGLIQALKSKGFIILAAIDPLISPEEVPAISSLFDGEIIITEKETAQGTRRTLRISKLYNQKYSETELTLPK